MIVSGLIIVTIDLLPIVPSWKHGLALSVCGLVYGYIGYRFHRVKH